MTTNEICSINTLPRDMLAEILRRSLSNSVTDFVNANISCKAFLEASKDHYIFENVPVDNNITDFVPWWKSERIFLKRCKDAKNTEALYRIGMVKYFCRRKLESGLRYLKNAADKGHVEATYTYGIILICLGGELKNKGLEILSSLTSWSTRNSRIAGCRWKTKKMLKRMWVRVPLNRPVDDAKPHCRCDCIAPNPWEASNDLDDNIPLCDSCFCDSCFWHREATLFSSMLRK